ncbi:DUF2142 domain-containing protein [Lactococcus garvieae]|uniref:DUF2142 domain-containing protein n=1 Tax=Lactococcus garvieae TaxID=1363 RepID=UPI0009BE32B4|nr:DUF2142 domain-containing protein [Lactococcus garvieae]
MEYVSKNLKKLAKDDFPVHKLYIVLVLLFGIIFSTAMPIFQEQDGQYHFATASAMADLSVNLSNYGEYAVGSGTDNQRQFYQNGTHFQQFYLQKVQIIPQEDVPRKINALGSKFNYDYMGHIIPALGVWIGYHIYPSLGVMTVVARLLNLFVCAIMMFFIIKWVKKGKLLFACVMLSPVAIISFASLSYDAINFVWVAFLIAYMINMLVSPKLSLKKEIPIIGGLGIIGILWFKTNYLVLFVMLAIILFNYLINRYYGDNLGQQRAKRKIITIISLVSLVAASGAFYYWSHGNGGVRHVVARLWASFGIISTPTPNLISQTLLAQSNRGQNGLPYWIAGVWFALLICILLVEDKYVKSKIVSFGALGVFGVSILAVYMAFISYNNAISGQIYGVQGRYFTPVLLLLSLFISNEKFKLKIKPKGTIIFIMIIIVIVSNTLIVTNTLSNMHGLFVEMRG